MKARPQILCLILVLLFAITVKAQVYYDDEKTGEEYEIDQGTNKTIINAFLKEQKATAIEFNPNLSSDFPFRLKNKKENWILFHAGYESLFMKRTGRKYSFQFPTSVMEESGFTLAKHKGKIFLVNLYDQEVETKMGFDEVVVSTKKDTLYTYDIDYNEKERVAVIIEKIVVRADNKWGLIELRGDDLFYLSRYLLYNSPEEVPAATGFQVYQLEMMENIRQEHNVDLLIALDANGYYFKGRNKKTKLFGLYVGEGEASESISSKYHNIIYHKYTGTYEVWKDGKVGYFNSNFELVFEPGFDDFKHVHLDYTYGCALKSNNKWELYDAFEPEKLVEGSTATIDELIELWLNR